MVKEKCCCVFLLFVVLTFLKDCPAVVFFFYRIFLLDTLNFCFWADIDQKLPRVKYRGSEWTGYRSLCAALTRAVEVIIYSSCATLIGGV